MMEHNQGTEMDRFLKICQYVIPQRVSLITNYEGWQDRIVMKGPHLSVSVKGGDDHTTISISDERGLSLQVPCEGVEIVEIQNTKYEFESHVYFFTFEGFARLNIIGESMLKDNIVEQPRSFIK